MARKKSKRRNTATQIAGVTQIARLRGATQIANIRGATQIASRAATDPTYVSPGFPNPRRRRISSRKGGGLVLLALLGVGYLVLRNSSTQ